MGAWIIAIGIMLGVADSLPKYVLRDGGYDRVPFGSLRNPCDGKLPIRDDKVLLFETSEPDFSTVGKAIKGTFYLWREYPCKEGRIHGIAKEFRSGKVIEAVPYKNGEVEGKKHVFYPSGKLKEILHFEGGKREGEYRKFDTSGRLLIVAQYDDNLLDGKVRYFDPLRDVVTVFDYDDGKIDGEPTYETNNVQEAFILAARNGHVKQIKKILAEGLAQKKVKIDGFGETEVTQETALIAALSAGHFSVVEALLAAGANPSQSTRSGQLSPLMVAVLSHQVQSLKALLKKKADPNWQNPDGNTALHLAVNKGEVELVQLLVSSGARSDVRNKKGVTPSAMGKGTSVEGILTATPEQPARDGE